MKKLSLLFIPFLLLASAFMLQGCFEDEVLLVFTVQPTDAKQNNDITPSVVVQIQNDQGEVIPLDGGTITLALGTNPSSGTLSGTLTGITVAGVTTFSDLNIDSVGTGYTLTASADNMDNVTSDAFNITPGVAATLEFSVQPSNHTSFQKINDAIAVRVLDSEGNLVEDANNEITLSFGNNAGELAYLSAFLENQGEDKAFQYGTVFGLVDLAIPSVLHLLESYIPDSMIFSTVYDSAQDLLYASGFEDFGKAEEGIANFLSLAPTTGQSTLVGDTTINAMTGMAFEQSGLGRLLGVDIDPGLFMGGGASKQLEPSQLYSITNTDGTQTPLGELSFLEAPFPIVAFTGMATDPTDGTIYVAPIAATIMEKAPPFVSVLGTLDTAEMKVDGIEAFFEAFIGSLTFSSSGQLYGTMIPPLEPAVKGGGPGSIYSIDKTNAQVTHVLSLPDNLLLAPIHIITMIPASLLGTVTVNAVNGIATFDNVKINSVADGYTLAASATGLTAATSNAFNITAPTFEGMVEFSDPEQTVDEDIGTPVSVQMDLTLPEKSTLDHDIVVTVFIQEDYGDKREDAPFSDIDYDKFHHFTILQGDTEAIFTFELNNDEDCTPDKFIRFEILDASMAESVGRTWAHEVYITDDDCIEE